MIVYPESDWSDLERNPFEMSGATVMKSAGKHRRDQRPEILATAIAVTRGRTTSQTDCR
jgi:hypothetical protein